HGGLMDYVGTFVVYCGFLRPAMRLSYVMNTPVTDVFTDNSIAVGEFGPTHDARQQLGTLRSRSCLSLFCTAYGSDSKESLKNQLHMPYYWQQDLRCSWQ